MPRYNPEDFCSKPGITMDELRREKANEVRTYIGYVEQILEEAEAMGLVPMFEPEINGDNELKFTVNGNLGKIY